MKPVLKNTMLFVFGGTAYVIIENIWRGFSHWSMFFAGGFSFQWISQMHWKLEKRVSFPGQCVLGSVIITSIEFVTGCVVNLWLKWGVWDYSRLPWNLLGQICLPFSLAWCALSAPILWVGDLLQHSIFEPAEQLRPKQRRRRLLE